MSAAAPHIAVILSPFLALPLVGWLGGRGRPRSFLPALIPAALTAYFTNLPLSFRFDGLTTGGIPRWKGALVDERPSRAVDRDSL